MTGLEVVDDALRLIGALSHGETADAQEAQDGLRRLNLMIDAWNTESLKLYVINRDLYPLTAGTQRYTIGPTGDFVQQRPQWISHMGMIQQQNQNQPIELPLRVLTTESWAHEIPVKNVTSALPTKVYVDGAFPNRNMDFWPLPSLSNLEVAVYWAEHLSQFTTLTTNLMFPPGYSEALIYNLATRLAPEFGRPLDPAVVLTAQDSLERLERSNNQTWHEELRVDAALTPNGHWDWRVGDRQ